MTLSVASQQASVECPLGLPKRNIHEQWFVYGMVSVDGLISGNTRHEEVTFIELTNVLLLLFIIIRSGWQCDVVRFLRALERQTSAFVLRLLKLSPKRALGG